MYRHELAKSGYVREVVDAREMEKPCPSPEPSVHTVLGEVRRSQHYRSNLRAHKPSSASKPSFSDRDVPIDLQDTSISVRIFQWTTVKLLGPIFMDVVGPLMATTESGKKAGTNFLNKYLAVRIVWCDYGAGKVYRFLNSAPMEMVQT
ncbi:hypothetical protein G5I_12646 [Acromyrmex echinatior]|uniref:Uncharacterized protein n=1 Tax=Acromyrmex echinatior TaxID=103372 RepID=F4X2W4_ACREC|nr:hypothetical protein G5I_12646 [Acromyrmex echinatior]